MRKTIISVAAAAAALTAAGVAIADHSGGTGGVAVAGADFSANRERSDTYTCTGADNKTYQISHGRYTGNANGNHPQLTGAIVVDVKSVYNQSDGIGWVEGRIKLRRNGDDERGSKLHLAGVISNGNNVDGFVSGGGGAAGVLGNMVASYTPDGSIAGKIGNGAAGAGLAVVRGRPCAKPKPDAVAVAVTLRVKGEVEGLNATGISVKPRSGGASQGCAVVAGVSPSVSGIVAKTATTPGTQVEIGCGVVNNQMTLLKLKKNGSKDDDDDDD